MVSATDFLQGATPTLVEQPEIPPTKSFVAGQNLSASDFLQGQSPVISEPVAEEEKLNFLERFGQDLQKRSTLATEIEDAVNSGEQSFAEGILQSAGKVGAGTILDLIGETLVSGGRGLSAITPDFIENPLKEGAAKGATAAAHFLLDTKVGKAGLDAAKDGVEAWFEFKEGNPRAARNIEAVVDIGLLLAPVKGKPKVKAGITPIGKAGVALEAKAATQVIKTKTAFVDGLVRPKQTAAVRKEQVSRTIEEGRLRTKRILPSKQEAEMAKAVNLVEGVGSKETLQGNYNIISKEVFKEADELIENLEKNKEIIPRGDVLSVLEDVSLMLKKDPDLVGDSGKAADLIIENFKELLKKQPETSAGLLKSRRALDRKILSSPKKKTINPNTQNGFTTALREIRQTVNDFVILKNPNVAVENSLKKQSNLLSAMENISPKAGEEGVNAAIRAWQNASRLLPLRGEFNQTMALMFGVGGLGAAATFAPFFTKMAFGGLGVYAGGKLLLSPQTKRGLASLLKQVDNGIRKTKDEALIAQMRADRALIVELLKEE